MLHRVVDHTVPDNKTKNQLYTGQRTKLASEIRIGLDCLRVEHGGAFLFAVIAMINTQSAAVTDGWCRCTRAAQSAAVGILSPMKTLICAITLCTAGLLVYPKHDCRR